MVCVLMVVSRMIRLVWTLILSPCLPCTGNSSAITLFCSFLTVASCIHREADIKPVMDLMSASDEDAIREAGLKDEEVSDYDRNTRIRAIDVMRTPKFERVWEVGGIGEVR